MEERSRIVLLAAAIRLAIAPFFMHAGDVGTIYESSIMVLKGANLYDFVYAKTIQMQSTTGLPVFFEGYAYHPLLILEEYLHAFKASFQKALKFVSGRL